MSAGYKAVTWTAQKRLYDTVLLVGVTGYLAAFVLVGLGSHRQATFETEAIRALGTCALLLLHVILAIGPLARLDRRFLVLLYNRRHLGVLMFLVALAHGTFATLQFHGGGDLHPLLSLLTANPRWNSLTQFPFQPLGLAALLILFAMAATSHDYWLKNLTAPVWKTLHMGVYLAYTLVVLHVALGSLQSGRHPLLVWALGGGIVGLAALHLLAARRERALDRPWQPGDADGAFIALFPVDSIPENRARIACVGGERIAVFRYDGQVSALSNVCQHQNGPLGEGKIVDGCVTCPWHGYQYLPGSGASPPPFEERVPTFRVRLRDRMVWVDPRPLPAGTPVEPATIVEALPREDLQDPFYVGWQARAEQPLARFGRTAALAGIVLGLLVGAGASYLQPRFDQGSYAWGAATSFEGTLGERPYPTLFAADLEQPPRLLVGRLKHGARALVAGLDGHHLRLSGATIESPVGAMVEVDPESIADLGTATLPATRERGSVRLVGEIVDSKCFLGAMRPGRGKTHRACAARCLSGGIPPLLLVQDRDGDAVALVLASEDGTPHDPRFVARFAEPVSVEGRIVARDGQLMVWASQEAIRALH